MKLTPSTLHGSYLPLIGLLIVSICNTNVKGRKNECVVPQGSQAVLCFGFDEENLTNSDLPSHVGDTVFGKCIVSKDDIVNDDLYITIDPKSCASQKPTRPIRNIKTVLIDERSVTFKLVNVSKYDEGFYQCRDSSSDRPLANIYLYVGRPPLKPYVSHNNLMIINWQNVSMTLSPSYHQQMSHIGECAVIFSLTWSIKYSLSRSTPFLNCGSEHSMTCSFALDDFQPTMTLFLEVTLKNVMDKTVTILEIDALDDRVKPASPTNLQVSNGSSTSLDISWESPNKDFAVLYMIGLTASNVKQKLLRNVTNITQITLSGLIPHAICTISISAKPLYYGLVSDEANILHEMKPDVPGQNPVFVPGGFDATHCGRNCRNVTIYWKPVPEQFSNGAIDYIVMSNGIRQEVDGNCSHHALTALAKDLPTTIYLFATNKDASIERNHSLPGTRLDVPADGKISMVSLVTYKEMNETHRLMTWVLNNADVTVSVVQCRESEEGGCEEKTPLGFTVTSQGQTSAVTLTGFRTGIGITKDGKEMGIFWSELAPERASVSQTNDDLTLILIVVGLVTLITCILIVGAMIFRQRSKRPVKMKTPKSPPSSGWVQSNDTEVFIGDATPVVHEVTHVPPTMEEDDSWTTPQDDSSNSIDDISSNSTESDELNDSYYHCNRKNCLFVEASDPGPIPNKALSSEADDVNDSCKVGRGVLKRQPGDEEEVHVANRRKVDKKSVSAEKGTILRLNMEDKDNNMAAVPVDGCECARQVGEGPGRCKDIELGDIEPEKMSKAKRDGTDDKGGLDPHTLETCLNQDNNSSCNNQALPHALSAATTSYPGTVIVEYHDNYSKVSFAKDLYK